MEILPLVLFCVLFAVAIFAPLRWSIVAYIMLSAVDFYSADAGVGIMNTMKGHGVPDHPFVAPKELCGSREMVLAPVMLVAADCLRRHCGVLVVISTFSRQADRGDVGIVPDLHRFHARHQSRFSDALVYFDSAAVGVLAIGVLRGLSCRTGAIRRLASLASPPLRDMPRCWRRSLRCHWERELSGLERWALCLALFVAVLLNGSRIYALGLLLSTDRRAVGFLFAALAETAGRFGHRASFSCFSGRERPPGANDLARRPFKPCGRYHQCGH